MTFWKKIRKVIMKIPLWLIGFGIGVLFFVIGFYERQFEDIFRKAVLICLECIGIG